MRISTRWLLLPLTVAAGCRAPATSAREVPVVGQWQVLGVDGVIGANGNLQVQWNTPPGEYEMAVSVPVADSFSSAGRYTWDGAVLVLTDSAGGPGMTGTLDATQTQMSLTRGIHVFQLHKLPQLPVPGARARARWSGRRGVAEAGRRLTRASSGRARPHNARLTLGV
jgi:hypothetical protein